MTSVGLIVAAGRGSRVGGADGPKQYRELAGKSLLTHALRPFLSHPAIDAVRVVIHADDRALYEGAVKGLAHPKLLAPCLGGVTRQASVRAGLASLAGQGVGLVLIHDAARPLISEDTIGRVLTALKSTKGAIAALTVADTLKREDARGQISETVDRTGLWRAQTPQGFDFTTILAAHERAAHEGLVDFTDDAALAEWAGVGVKLVSGEARNIKVTTPEDFSLAQALLDQTRPTLETRTGTGFDVHRFAEGDHVWLCGVRIPHTHRLEGHSDADVALHALTDALLGAIGDGDIGQHFPPSDPQWRGAASRLFLEDANRRIKARGGRITNVDITLLCEAPRVGPHREDMRNAIAGILQFESHRVGVKATTTEGLGFTGRREGIAAMASATIQLPAAISTPKLT